MRTRLLTSALLLTLCCAALPAQEQNYVPTPVTISKEKVKLGDKTYYSHVVLERQTLYSIAKAYGVAVEDIYAANPELELEKNGLKKNSIIRIPIADEKAVALSAPNDAADGVTHTVKWYEDLQGIAEKYGVSPESIMEANGLRDGKLKSRMKLIIPSSSKSESVAITEPQVEPEEEAETNIVEGDGSLPAKTDDELA
ncbi:MAG: LysM peptidoglycan-binding domain-containing protein, partial [Candidatus Cryptobacteroides sp.]|nr:LysM peptidoglycan-binding domain-containing protein [Bacteroidales bacterium]MDY5743153.1 LysM peptidoglycan-binding domain-containing protein [Candidatus Cryptobacteroides sp.]